VRERDARGRFVKGHKGVGGRPPRAVEEQYMHALVQAMPIEQFLKTCQVHAARAQAGDLATWRTFLERLLGKPRESKQAEELSEALRGLLVSGQVACDSDEPDAEPS